MAKKNYAWEDGATLDEHSKQKHKILREYFRQYLITRCKLPQQEMFRLAVVDGFCGGGRYKCGSSGSPLIFIEVLKNVIDEINITRSNQGMRPIQIECFLSFNDLESVAVNQLQEHISPLHAEIIENNDNLHIKTDYYNEEFATAYPKIKQKLLSAKYKNVLFNLDQCGYSLAATTEVKDIMNSWKSAEVFLTFSINEILAYISPNQEKNNVHLEPHIHKEIYASLENGNQVINKNTWLGVVERTLFESLKGSAPFASPFSINNPDGWRYWLMHFANSYRARQVYNDVLHDNCTSQAHFGRSGLNMLSYDPSKEGALYLFDTDSRESAKKELHDDIPKFIIEHGDVLRVDDFYMSAYNETPAHSDDIHEMIIENPDIEVMTQSGGTRRKANTIKPTDTLKLKNQKSMFPMFFSTKNKTTGLL